MTPRTKAQNEEIRNRRIAQIVAAAADVYLDKGMLMEIRDVARVAGLGYGTVYHYYKNKIDLLHDLLWQAMERMAMTVQQLIDESQGLSGGKLPYEEARVSGTGDRPVESEQENQQMMVLVSGILKAWSKDHAAYLVCQLGNEAYRQLPEEQASPLAKVYLEYIIAPLSTVLEQGEAGVSSDMMTIDAENKAQMLLSAMCGCTLLPLRRGTLRSEAEGIASFLCAGLM